MSADAMAHPFSPFASAATVASGRNKRSADEGKAMKS
jgi:hypothetical protein